MDSGIRLPDPFLTVTPRIDPSSRLGHRKRPEEEMLACRLPGSNSVNFDLFAAHAEDDHALGCYHRQLARTRSNTFTKQELGQSQLQPSDIEPPPHKLPLSHKTANLRLLKCSKSTQSLFDKLRSQSRVDTINLPTSNNDEDKENNTPPTETPATIDHQSLSLDSDTQTPYDEESARLEAETDRIIAEQKRLDLVRLQAQLATVKTPPRKLKRLILGKLSFSSRGKYGTSKARPRAMVSPQLVQATTSASSPPPEKAVPFKADRKAAAPKNEALTPVSNPLEQSGTMLHGLRSWYNSNKRSGPQKKRRVPISPDYTPHSGALYMIAVYPTTLSDEETSDADCGIQQPMEIDSLDEAIEGFNKASKEESEILRERETKPQASASQLQGASISTKPQPQMFETPLDSDSRNEFPGSVFLGSEYKEHNASAAIPTPITPQHDCLFTSGIPGINQRLRCSTTADLFDDNPWHHPSLEPDNKSVRDQIPSSGSVNTVDNTRHQDHIALSSLQTSPTIRSSRRLQLALKSKSKPRRRTSGQHNLAARMDHDEITPSTERGSKTRVDIDAVAPVSTFDHVPSMQSVAFATQKLSAESVKFGAAPQVAPAVYTESLLETPITLLAPTTSGMPSTSLQGPGSQDSLLYEPGSSDGVFVREAVAQAGASPAVPSGNLTDLPLASGAYSESLGYSESNYSDNQSTIGSSTHWSADYVNLLKPTQTDESTSRTTLDACFDCCSSPIPPFDLFESSTDNSHRLLQRRNVIKELIDTERAFVRDMYIVDVVYRGTADACPLLDELTLKVIFRNMSEVIALHTGFLAHLEEAVSNVYVLNAECISRPDSTSDLICLDDGNDSEDAKDRTTTVGSTFLADIENIKTVYKDFLSTSDYASKRLIQVQQDPTVQQWLNECKQAADDLTEAWDLDSLLIKPLQRITKYPSIIFALLQYTPWDHPDREPLMQAKYKLDKAIIEIDEMMRDCKVAAQIMDTNQRNSNRTTGIVGAFGKGVAKLQPRKPDSRAYDACRSHQGYQSLD